MNVVFISFREQLDLDESCILAQLKVLNHQCSTAINVTVMWYD